LPPIQQGREFDSLNTAGNSETEKQPVEMSFHGSPRHIELGGDFGVVAALQKQVHDLLFAWTEPNSLLLHSISPSTAQKLPHRCNSVACLVTDCHSIHIAILRLLMSVTKKHHFSTGTCRDFGSLRKTRRTMAITLEMGHFTGGKVVENPQETVLKAKSLTKVE
jgi:hypothetical protein